MSEEIMKWIPWAILFVLFTSLLVLIHKKFKKHNVMEEIANKYRENMDEKKMVEAAFVTRYAIPKDWLGEITQEEYVEDLCEKARLLWK